MSDRRMQWLAAAPRPPAPAAGAAAPTDRSACSISMTVAFATSIPTSMTLVATQDVHRVVTERPNRRVALLRLEPAVHQTDLELRKHLGEPLRHHGRGLKSARSDSRSPDRSRTPAAGTHSRAIEFVDLLAAASGAERRLHRAAPGGRSRNWVSPGRRPYSVSASERGIGVAVSSSTSGASPFSTSAARCSTPSVAARRSRPGRALEVTAS